MGDLFSVFKIIGLANITVPILAAADYFESTRKSLLS